MNASHPILPFEKWFPQLNESPVIIAGPCSAESELQLLSTALEISKIERVKIYRTGIWKPRTRPGSFEGVGKIGLEWLAKVKAETGLLTAVEVATPQHVEHCLKVQNSAVDILWIGARTTGNPFAVQELVNSLKGCDIPILVKNPVNPDIDLWIGALERFNYTGISRLAAVHRGFYPFEKTSLRNIPKWELPIELKIRFPNLPVICDPSHIAGKVDLIESIAQKALDLDFDGLMIETHINPKEALSDAKQQITPDELGKLLDKLNFRKISCQNSDFNNRLEQYREQIDSIDTQMLELLSQRNKIVGRIGNFKKDNNVTIFQLRRWTEILATRTELARRLGLSTDFTKKLLQLVHEESIRIQTDVFNHSESTND